MKPTTITFDDETEYVIPEDCNWAVLDAGSIAIASKPGAGSSISKRFEAGHWVYLTEHVPGKNTD